jgi:hypothetical protein
MDLNDGKTEIVCHKGTPNSLQAMSRRRKAGVTGVIIIK